MNLTVVILNYNTKDLLRDCLNNLVEMWNSIQIIVVDSASTDGSAQMVKGEFSENVELVEMDKNYGIATGYNIAVKKANGNYILYLGTDAYPDKTDILACINYLEENEDVGIATARLVKKDGTPDMDAHRGLPTPLAAITHFTKLNKLFPKSRFFNQYFIGWEDLETVHEIDVCISHFMLVRREVHDQGVYWNQEYFVFGEDVDFCYETKKAGWKIIYLGNIEVLHFGGAGVIRGERNKDATVKTASSTNLATQIKMKKASTNAMRIFYKKHFSKKYGLLVLPVLGAIAVLEYLRVRSVKKI